MDGEVKQEFDDHGSVTSNVKILPVEVEEKPTIKMTLKKEEESILENFCVDDSEDAKFLHVKVEEKPTINLLFKEEEEYILDNSGVGESEDNQFSCYHCNAKYAKLWILRSHIKHCHLNNLGTEDLKFHLMSLLTNPNSLCEYVNPPSIRRKKYKNQKEFQCLMCDYRTDHKGNMKRHKVARHSINKTFQCLLCDYLSHRSDSLKEHVLRNHTNKRTFHHCPFCDYAGLEPRLLRRHLRNEHEHNNKKRSINNDLKQVPKTPSYQCLLCDHRSMQIYEINRHMVRKHGEKQHKCSKCKYKSAYAVDLRRHIASCHTNERPYKCKYCYYKTAIPGHLKRHMRGKKHKILIKNTLLKDI